MRYLMRAASSPFANPTHYEALVENNVNGNSGNLLFSYSVARWLMHDEAEIDFVKTNRFLTDEDVESMNASYDAFIIPLANAFRESFTKELDILSDMVERLDMPCIVIGVGYQGSLDAGSERQSHSWDEHVRRFCSAVLEKSTRIGVRGEITAGYLEMLGYVRGQHFDVIGCPSMFLYGRDLPTPRLSELTPESRISTNGKAVLSDKFLRYMNGVRAAIPDHYYVVQNHYELKTLYAGINIHLARKGKMNIPEGYPIDYSHELYRENRVRGFVNVPSWFGFLSQCDFSFGSRIHGNIAAVLSGTPTLIIAPDSRVLELADYHDIAYTTVNELDESISIFDLASKMDFSKVSVGHEERFNCYLAFFHENQLRTLFDDPTIRSTFDDKIRAVDFNGPVVPFLHAPYNYQLQALEYRDYLLDAQMKRADAARRDLRAYKAKVKQEAASQPLIIRGLKKMLS